MNEWGPSEWAAVVGVGLGLSVWIVRGERRASTFVTRDEMLRAAQQVKTDADARLDKQDKALDKIADRIEVNFAEARKEWDKDSDFRHTIASTVSAMGAKIEVMLQRNNSK
jgi:hypothetical protein